MDVGALQTVTLHHAYIIVGGEPSTVLEALGVRGVTTSGNPDVLTFAFSDLLVDDARALVERAFLKSVGDAKYFVISFSRAGLEAQNALLKVVEEAPGNTHFFFCVQNVGAVIPTLRSRCVVLTSDVDRTSDVPGTPDVRDFLKASYADRLSRIEKIVTAAQRSGDRSAIRDFVRNLVIAHPSRETLTAARYLELNGSSPKLVLSHLAVALPQV